MNDTIIEIDGLTKKFGSLTAVDNLDLKVYKGDIFGFLGPNGAGKSTTIRMLLSLIKPTSGSIEIFGLSIKRDRKNIMRRIGAIVEKPDFYLYLTAYKNLEILGRLSGADVSKNKIMEMLELVGLASRHNSKVKTFSHGMKQRLGLAQALLHDPELIILDEPTTGLDPQGMKEIRELILYLCRSKGKTIFLSSHILHEVEMIANRMIIINKGKKIVEGNVSELLRSDRMNVSFEVSDPLKASDIIKEVAASGEFQPGSNKITLSLTQKEISELNKKLVENGIEVYSIVPVRSLEEYFLKITEGANND
ncbi:ABC transporter ATP-binding protein [Melioribacter sp. Ez-97]|uniref:ABC transporter ATP-binding protein n=1 Tax=Melioribacter sp. Ez-97 TaxID=3423434 RepID=UPI003ED88C43